MPLAPNMSEAADKKMYPACPGLHWYASCNGTLLRFTPAKKQKHCFNSVVVIDVNAEAEKEEKKMRKEASVVIVRMNTNLTIHMSGADAGIEGKHEFPWLDASNICWQKGTFH